MSTLIESLKRLFTSKRLTKEEIQQRVVKGTITAEEYTIICGEMFVGVTK
ncbi:MAG: XkdX family protein [Clostridia bacterium]